MIDAAELRKLCLSFRGLAETFPFGAKTSVFKVVGKIVRPGKRGNPAGEGDDPAEDGDAILPWSVARLLLAVPVLLAVPELSP